VIEPILYGVLGGLAGALIYRIVVFRLVKPRGGRVPIASLCYTGRTVYGVDRQGRVWYVNLESGGWTLHGNPTEDDAMVKR
jgi:hypothetical protein